MAAQTEIRVLHIAPHLGGGIGKALASLVQGSYGTGITHAFLLLERPEKTEFLKRIESLGCTVGICPDENQADILISHADIVQLEWWNHPATFRFLCTRTLPAMRLLTWCHQSGLHPPLIPEGLIRNSVRFIFTSPSSLQAPYITGLDKMVTANTGVVSSGTGLDRPKARKYIGNGPMKSCYMGTLSFSKLHPEYVQFLSAVTLPEFGVTMIGDEVNRDVLLNQCVAAGKPGLLEFAGYVPDIGAALAAMDIFPYLLNPVHYGTAENALLEAMSAGVVPIVLDNPCEIAIIEDGKTGLVVESPADFAKAVARLSENPAEREKLGRNAALFVSENFTPKKMAVAMATHYRTVFASRKRTISFSKFLGSRPVEWYRATRRKPGEAVPEVETTFDRFRDDDETKGSIRHFRKYFPDNGEL
jgi:L-malate glycosyltransferase